MTASVDAPGSPRDIVAGVSRLPLPFTATAHGMAVALAFAFAFARPAHADEVLVAVASNFASPLRQIAERFTAETGHRVSLASGSTGKLRAQIQGGAPFAVLIAADEDTPAQLVDEGLAVPGTSFTYAVGKLVLWSAIPGRMDGGAQVLRTGGFKHLAVANPKLAPYGAAAMEVLHKLGLAQTLASRIVQGENIAQAHQFVATGNAELGFVALSQVVVPGQPPSGSFWLVPADWHAPIRQNAVLLRVGAEQPAAKALLAYLRSDAARSVIRSWGYGL